MVGFPVLLRKFKQTKALMWPFRARRGSDHFGGGGDGYFSGDSVAQ